MVDENKQSVKIDEKQPFPQFSLNVSNPISWKLMLLIMLMQLLTKYDVSNCIISKIINMENHFKRSTYDNIKSSFLRNLKSSQRFGETSVFSKNLSVFSKNLKHLLKERRFLYFTKRGPIEVVFNIKHYISAFILVLVFTFKMLQLVFFGFSSFFAYLTYKNTEITSQSFTKNRNSNLKRSCKRKNN